MPSVCRADVIAALNDPTTSSPCWTTLAFDRLASSQGKENVRSLQDANSDAFAQIQCDVTSVAM